MAQEPQESLGRSWRLVLGRGGWARYEDDEIPGVVYFRFSEHKGRLMVGELYAANQTGITVRLLQKLPLGQIESAVSYYEITRQIREEISEDLSGKNAQAPSRAMSRLVPESGKVIRRNPGHISTNEYRGPAVLVTIDGPLGEQFLNCPQSLDETSIAAAGKRPDSFYRQVARLFLARRAEGSKAPALDISEAHGVPVTTVHRWVKEARRRGFLTPSGRRSGEKETRQ